MREYTADFALVGEGVTDHAVLRNLLRGYFKGQDREPAFTAKQPDRDATSDTEWQKFGNWENVFRYLREGHYRDALQFNQYLVVQVDTDCSEHPNFGVPRHAGGKSLEVPIFVERVAARIRREIGEEGCCLYADRLLFAVCVDSIECWLLPLWTNAEGHQAKTTGCLEALNRGLAQNNESGISPDAKRAEAYDRASSGYRKRTVLLESGARNPSLQIFLEGLDARRIQLQMDD